MPREKDAELAPPRKVRGSSTAGPPVFCAAEMLTLAEFRPPMKHDMSALAERAGTAAAPAHMLAAGCLLKVQASTPTELAGADVPMGHAVHPE